VECVESNEDIQHIKVLHELLHETYKYKAMPKSVKSFRTKGRKGIRSFDSAKTASFKFDEDTKTITNIAATSQWQSIAALPSFNSGGSYCEFKINLVSAGAMFVGIGTKTYLATRGMYAYPGQAPDNSCGLHCSSGIVYTPRQTGNAVAYTSGDVIGIYCNLAEKKLVFVKNGTQTVDASYCLGTIMATAANSREDIFPLVSLHGAADSVTLLSNGNPPTCCLDNQL